MAARGLGKGLDSLIPVVETPVSTKKKKENDINALKEGEAPVMVKITKVEPNRQQPRKKFDEDALLELADSIKQYGLLQPILVQDRKTY